MYIRSLAGAFSSRLLELRAIGELARLYLEKHGIRLQTVVCQDSSSFKSMQSNLTMISLRLSSGNCKPLTPLALTLAGRFLFRPRVAPLNGSRIWVLPHVFQKLRMKMLNSHNFVRIFSSSFRLRARLTGRLLKSAYGLISAVFVVDYR
eukprot:21690_6